MTLIQTTKLYIIEFLITSIDEKIPEIAKQQVTLFAFGAGHLGGDVGVINLLREKGYTVEPVMDK
ncbi:MAG: TraB/GumN family protein [Gammaproteobacteria bacterium]